jgi:hypothetical protein
VSAANVFYVLARLHHVDRPVLATCGGKGARNRYLLGVEADEPSEVNDHQLQTAIARAFEVPGVTEVVVHKARGY